MWHRSSAGHRHWSCSGLHRGGRRPGGLCREHCTGSHSGREEVVAADKTHNCISFYRMSHTN